jgi:hypothetical protein
MQPMAKEHCAYRPLLADDELYHFRGSWDEVQTSFVEELGQVVGQADSLAANGGKHSA